MNSSKKRNIFILVAISCLYFAGIASIIYPILSNVLSMSTAKTVINDYTEAVQKMDDSEIKEKFEKAQQYNQELAKKNYDSDLGTVLNGNDGLICYLEVPSISVYLPVYYGTTDEVLQKGCGLLENTSLPIGGESTHSVISGHTGLPSADMFTKLDEVEIGELFYIHILDQILAYRVDQILTVVPNNTEDLFVIDGEDHVTLLTCTPYGINDKRLLVRGTRTDYVPTVASGDEKSIANSDSADEGLAEQIRQQMSIVWFIVIIAVVLFIIACVWVMKVVTKPSHVNDNDDSDSGGTE